MPPRTHRTERNAITINTGRSLSRVDWNASLPIPGQLNTCSTITAPPMINGIFEKIIDINKTGVSILLVEHNLKVAMSLADRVYLMGKAHLGFTGTKEELDARPDIRAKYLEV